MLCGDSVGTIFSVRIWILYVLKELAESIYPYKERQWKQVQQDLRSLYHLIREITHVTFISYPFIHAIIGGTWVALIHLRWSFTSFLFLLFYVVEY